MISDRDKAKQPIGADASQREQEIEAVSREPGDVSYMKAQKAPEAREQPMDAQPSQPISRAAVQETPRVAPERSVSKTKAASQESRTAAIEPRQAQREPLQSVPEAQKPRSTPVAVSAARSSAIEPSEKSTSVPSRQDVPTPDKQAREDVTSRYSSSNESSREVSAQPRETSAQPTEPAAQPREASTQPTEPAAQPREASAQPTEPAAQPEGVDTSQGPRSILDTVSDASKSVSSLANRYVKEVASRTPLGILYGAAKSSISGIMSKFFGTDKKDEGQKQEEKAGKPSTEKPVSRGDAPQAAQPMAQPTAQPTSDRESAAMGPEPESGQPEADMAGRAREPMSEARNPASIRRGLSQNKMEGGAGAAEPGVPAAASPMAEAPSQLSASPPRGAPAVAMGKTSGESPLSKESSNLTGTAELVLNGLTVGELNLDLRRGT